MIARNRNLVLATGAAFGALAFYTFWVEPRWLQRTHTRLHFRSLPPALEGLRIGLLSDLHASRATPPGLIGRAVDSVLAARPELIAVAGDIAEDGDSLQAAVRELARLRAPLGVYIVPGNHDHTDVGIDTWREAMQSQNRLHDVTNTFRVVEVSRGGEAARLCVAGVDDFAHGDPRLEALAAAGARDFTILVAHNPDQAERARRELDAVDLVLSGHTHGGQIRLPLLGAVVNSAEHADLYEYGVRRRPWTQVFTSRGVGTSGLRARLLARPEVAVLTLTADPRPGRWGAAPRNSRTG